MSHLMSVKRTLAVVGTGLVTVAAGLVVLSGPTSMNAAPAPAELRNVASTPDRYSPRPGVLHNTPIGTRAQQYALFTHINRSINSSPRGSFIRFAVYSFSDMTTANNLIRAHRRGVNVQLVFNGHAMFRAERTLRNALGTNTRRRSYTVFCDGTCRSGGGEMHAKFFQFSQAGSSRFVTMIGSNNMTSHNAERQWSDLTTVVGWDDIYRKSWTWFYQLVKDRPVSPTRIIGYTPRNLLMLLPQNVEKYGDPAMKALAPVNCSLAPTEIRISMHAWYGPRGQRIADRVADLARSGCRVWVFYGEAFGSSIRQTLAEAGVRIHTSRHRPKTHQKLLIVKGGYGGNANAMFAWTGSHNWSPWALKIEDTVLRVSNRGFVQRYIAVFNWTWMHA